MTAIPNAQEIGYPVRVHWASDMGPERPLNNIKFFICHDTEGNMASDEQVLTANDNNIASTHALIAPDGSLVFMVPLEVTAWTPGNDYVAERSINVEMSGFASKGYTDAQYRSMANFFNWCSAQGVAIPVVYSARTGNPGIIGHQDVPNPYQAGKFGGASGHTDPGPLFDWNKFIGYIKAGAKLNVNNSGGGFLPGEGQTGPKPFDPNPDKKDVGPGVLEVATADRLHIITNEDFFVPEHTDLGKRSFTYVQNTAGETLQVQAVQQVDASGKPTGPWKRELWKLDKEYDKNI